MKAWILHNPNNMTYEETEKPQPKSDEVLVAVKAAGICGSDIPRAFVTGAHVHPIIIGHEFSGQVYYVCVPVCGVLMVIYGVFKIVDHFKKLRQN